MNACNLRIRLHAIRTSFSFCVVSIEKPETDACFFSTPTPFKCHLDISKTLNTRDYQLCKPRKKILPLCMSCISLQLWVSMHLSALCCDLELHTCASTTWKRIISAPCFISDPQELTCTRHGRLRLSNIKGLVRFFGTLALFTRSI